MNRRTFLGAIAGPFAGCVLSLIRARLRQDGWRVPTGTAAAFTRRVLTLPLPGRLRSEIAPLLAVMRQVNHQIAYSDEWVVALTATHGAPLHKRRPEAHPKVVAPPPLPPQLP